MIDFKCQCGHQFSEPEDHAGFEFQCPQCLRLVDVPKLSDLAAIAPDGTYVLTHPAPQPVEAIPTFDEVVHAFRRGTHDVQGDEIDLRHDNDALANVGNLSSADLEKITPTPPRYDPETGELLTPVDMAPHVVRPIQIIDPRTANTLKYAVAATDPNAVHIWRVPRELFKVTNLAVMAFSFFCILLLAFTMLTLAYIFPLGLVAMIGLVLLSHYGAIPHEIGYKDRDDLPRPLGDLEWIDDVFAPLGNLFFSLAICYAPFFFAAHKWPNTPPVRVALLALLLGGSAIFPAVFLTVTNAGTLLNLRPDRVLGVIRATGAFYLVLVVEWIIAAPLYAISTYKLIAVVQDLVYRHAPHWWLPVAITAVAVAIYLFYLFLWQLGLTYRKWGDQFPWILQQHMRQRK